MSYRIKRARKIMRNALKDEGLHEAYQANIAVILMDELNTDFEERNRIAEIILRKIFEPV